MWPPAVCFDSFQVVCSVVNRDSGTGPFNLLCLYICIIFRGEGQCFYQIL